MSDEKKCREAFEAHFRLDYPQSRRNELGEYTERAVNGAWLGWQAAWNRRQQVPESVYRTIREVCESYRRGKWGKAAEAIGDNIIDILADAAPSQEEVK